MDAEESNRLRYTFSRYVAEQFAARYDIMVCPYFINVYSKKNQTSVERICAPIFDINRRKLNNGDKL